MLVLHAWAMMLMPRCGACMRRAALLAVWGAQALLLALALKLKASAAAASDDSPMPSRVAPFHVSQSYLPLQELVYLCLQRLADNRAVIDSTRSNIILGLVGMGNDEIGSLYAQAGSLYTEQAAGFLGSCLTQGLLPPGLPGARSMRGPGVAALQRLAAEGLGWVPTVGNLATLLCFALALALNAQLTQVGSCAVSPPGMHHAMIELHGTMQLKFT
jgi:hypothetical protein